MASTPRFGEDNGAVQSGHGQSRAGILNTNYATDVNWKNADNCTANGGTSYTANPILAGNKSFDKYQYGIITGTFNTIYGGSGVAYYDYFAGPNLGTINCTLMVGTGVTYNQPVTSASPVATNSRTVPVVVTSSTINPTVGGTGPEVATNTSSAANPCYTSYLVSQLVTSSNTPPGDLGGLGSVTLQLVYQES